MKKLPLLLLLLGSSLFAQEKNGKASVGASIGENGTGKIIVEARGELPKPPLFYTASIESTVVVSSSQVDTNAKAKVKVLQGEATTFRLALSGGGEVVQVQGKTLASWAVETDTEKKRYLTLSLKKSDQPVVDHVFSIQLKQEDLELPALLTVASFGPDTGASSGFQQLISLQYRNGVDARPTKFDGFLPLANNGNPPVRFQSKGQGNLVLSLSRDGVTPQPVEMISSNLVGEISEDGKSASFELTGTVRVSEAEASLRLLEGDVAIESFPGGKSQNLVLVTHPKGGAHYELHFDKPGEWPVKVEFVASIQSGDGWKQLSFRAASGTVAPISLKGFEEEVTFRDGGVITEGESGFLPATGHCHIAWKEARKIGEGKLFFSTTAKIETRVTAGLLKQIHQVEYRILQGELSQLDLDLAGEGEILNVEGPGVAGWKLDQNDNGRQLSVKLSQPIKDQAALVIRTQQPLSAFPVKAEPLQITPIGTVRHSGHIRLTNEGSVRLETSGLSGLTQLSPDQYPDAQIAARQIFVYRFPSAEYAYEITADRIQPETSVSEILLYRFSDTDRVIESQLELDIREAPIREWNLLYPEGYSVVSVSGASVADYVVGSEPVDGQRTLKIIFNADVSGRQLVALQWELSTPSEAGDWILPRIEHPDAEAIRGDIGVISEPGFRIGITETELLVEKPLSYFPKQVPGLQQAFRIREQNWSATMSVEVLAKSIQADVFHLYSLSEGTAYGSVLINYFVTGAPISELSVTVPSDLGNVTADGKDVRSFRQDEETLFVTLHQPVIGAYTLLITFEEPLGREGGTIQPGRVTPLGVEGERGFLQIVSPMQVKTEVATVSDTLLKLDALELPAEFQLLSAAPSLGAWQYTSRPFDLAVDVTWYEPGTTVGQVIEFSEIQSRVSRDGEVVSDLLYYVKSRGRQALRLDLPENTRLWAVSVAGKPVTARQAGESTLIPLPAVTDSNAPSEVRLRLGRPVVEGENPTLQLPRVTVPVLKTEWSLIPDENYVLVPSGGTVSPPAPVLRPTGFEWLAENGMGLVVIVLALLAIGMFLVRLGGIGTFFGVCFYLASGLACIVSATRSFTGFGPMNSLQISLPVTLPQDLLEISIQNTELWQANISWLGALLVVAGISALVFSLFPSAADRARLLRVAGIVAIALGILLQRNGTPYFFLAVGLGIAILLIPRLIHIGKDMKKKRAAAKKRKAEEERDEPTDLEEGGGATATTLIGALLLSLGTLSVSAQGIMPADLKPANEITQEWKLSEENHELKGTGSIRISGETGDRFLLLRAPAVLTKFEAEGLRITRQQVEGLGLCYLITIPEPAPKPVVDEDPFADPFPPALPEKANFLATFSFEMDVKNVTAGFSIPTGPAAVQKIEASYDQPDWQFQSPEAIRIDSKKSEQASTASILLAPRPNPKVFLRPQARDVSQEETQFFVEASHLYLPSPGVIDGRHRIQIRPAQGQISDLTIEIPEELTVSGVTGPIATWQFDADTRLLQTRLEPAQSKPFVIMVETQRGLAPLPADATLAPLRVLEADSDVGRVALAFGPDAQPEKTETETLSLVNLSDFDKALNAGEGNVMHRVYRYGTDGGSLDLRVAPVAPEIRVNSKQVISLGDERVVLAANLTAEITRAGLFQLSFPLPEGLEVESLSGDSLHHWAELTEEGNRIIVMHLNGKTIGAQAFSVSLTGSAPDPSADWNIPRFELREANRQTGELILQPTTGIRLRTLNRQNVSEVDPRTLGGNDQGALAFRLLQKDWTLNLGIEKLDPWLTGEILQEITLREGQTRTVLFGNFQVENASIQDLLIRLPITDEEVIRTLRATGDAVSDLVKVPDEEDLWRIQFKRRMIGRIDLRIEYEFRGDRANDQENLQPASLPDARQLASFFAVRAGGRLEIEPGELPRGWQNADWNTVPQSLREAGNRTAPALSLRTISPDETLPIRVDRHSLAESLKLRVARGELTSVLSPLGDQLTSVSLTMEVVQRSGLTVGLPPGGDLFSIFVNGESVHSVRQGDSWQFYILPGADDKTAEVRFVYSIEGEKLHDLALLSPELNVPLENIEWNVVAPKGFSLTDRSGNLELKQEQRWTQFDKSTYLSKAKGEREAQAQKAATLLKQANDFLQEGDQSKARWAFNSVANQYALDAASNEDARVQLENLKKQQAVVGLNTRRQRLFLNNPSETPPNQQEEQIESGINQNRVLQAGDLNYRPQEVSQLLQGNTSEDNAALTRIAGRLVDHQRSTLPAPQAITITLPEEGTVYTFQRTVQVSENAPLSLDLTFSPNYRLAIGSALVLVLLLLGLAFLMSTPTRGKKKA